MIDGILWCLIDPDDWEESYELDPQTKAVAPRLEVGDKVEIEFLLELGQLRTFGAASDAVGKNKGTTPLPFITPLGEGIPYCHFGGRILEIHTSPPRANDSMIYGGLVDLVAVMDCGLPVYLQGLTGQGDPLLVARGHWIEGISTLWGNPARPLFHAKRTKVTIESIRELEPARIDGRKRVFRLAAVRSGQAETIDALDHY
jgi:hypothetical protein